jgi:zinc transport system ATP-binding protein
LLARALVRKPDLLVLDEPLQGVDVAGQADLYRRIGQVRHSLGAGVVLVSHDLHLVMAESDRVVCLNHHVCCAGRPEAVSRDPQYLALFGPAVAVYTHSHDHHHDHSGEVIPHRSHGAGDVAGDREEVGHGPVGHGEEGGHG